MPETKQKIEGFVFVVTYGRSGSTLVQNLLNAIPGYCIRGENNNALAPLVRAWRRVSWPAAKKRPGHVPRTTDPTDPWFGAEHVDSKRYGRALASLYVQEILTPPAGTRVAGCKEIRWANEPDIFAPSLSFLHRFLPNCRFVFNTRDHDEVRQSGWWKKQDPAAVKKQLADADQLFHDYQSRYPERCIHLHYNDYTREHALLRPLFEFLGESWEPEMVDWIMNQKLTHLQEQS